jgi:hypothetical protein
MSASVREAGLITTLGSSPGTSTMTYPVPCRAVVFAAVFLLLGTSAPAQPTFPKPKRYEPTADERARIARASERLAQALTDLPANTPGELRADVAVFHRAAAAVTRLGDFYEAKDVAATLRVLERGQARAAELAAGKPGWASARGSVGRGYTSKVDGTVQPYAVVVPEGLALDRLTPARLDVVLHGRDATISEVRFLDRHDGKPTPKGPAHEGKITLHVFGRGNNSYRWAGETDVFEAIEAVRRAYPVDDRRVVLRGFSMGGAGAWHLGLHHPGLWSSVEAGAGFTETRMYAKLKDVPPFQEKALHIYDAVDYALNAFNVPMAGYGGEDDPQLRASTNIVEALKALGFGMKTEGLVTRGEGIDFVRIVGAKMGHKVDPASATLLNAFHDEHARAGLNLNPKRVRFVTYTVKYGKAAWLSVESLREHYRRAEVDAEIVGDRVVVRKAENVGILAVDRHAGATIDFGGGRTYDLETAVKGLLPNVYFRQSDEGGWRQLDYNESRAVEENADHAKRRGLQGPIDDAFTGPFLCVRGTATPWSPAAGRWSAARLEQFAATWASGMRGEVAIKDDVAVTADDLAEKNLILFGDPGSNRQIARVLKDLPTLVWTRSELKLAGVSYTPADHVPVLIAPNPLNPRRYVVLNTGHTFGAAEFAGTNALLYPRLGDYAVMQTDGRNATVKASGYFDEGWSLRAR